MSFLLRHYFETLGISLILLISFPVAHAELVVSGDSEGSQWDASYQVADRKTQASTHLFVGDDNKGFVFYSGDFVGKYCVGPNEYFTHDGGLGKKGKILKKELLGNGRSTPMKHLLFRNRFPEMSALCPKFDSFNDKEKLNFWIFYLTATARVESLCGRHEYLCDDPMGSSVGDLQLPESYKISRWWRGIYGGAGGCEASPPPEAPKVVLSLLKEECKTEGNDFGKNIEPMLMAQTQNNLACGVEILSGVLCGFYHNPIEECNPSTTPPFGGGFWKEIRVGLNGKIPKIIRKFPLCN